MRIKTKVTPRDVQAWFRSERLPLLSKGAAVELLHSFHPRSLFLKGLPPRSRVLDMGAGDGSLAIIRSWPEPARNDLALYAVSLSEGVHFGKYDGYEIANWEISPPDLDGMSFGAIMSSHFIEHIRNPEQFLSWACSRLEESGRLYVEWPTESSLTLPSRVDLEKAGVTLTISSFFDDATHLQIPSRESVIRQLEQLGFCIEQQGVIRNPFLEEELLAHFQKNREDEYALQFAYWSWTSWAQFLVASRPSR